MFRWGCVCLLISTLLAGSAAGQEPASNPPENAVDASVKLAPQPAASGRSAAASATVGRSSLWALIRQANPMLWPLVLCSVVALGFALERLVALRRSRIVPRDFVERFLDRLSSGKLDRDRALELCRANESLAARVFGHAVRHWGQSAPTIRQAVSHDAAAELLDLKRNCRVLNATATLAPLLGLLGTVVGLIEAFDALSQKGAGPGKNEALAHGISLALMATAFGLVIAVISVAVYYFLLHRIDALVKDLDDKTREVIDQVASEPGTGRAPADRRPLGGVGEHARHARSEVL